ncbi:hypothetical protein OG455_39000 [Kitasatospora sp. NBC_01287]|uniref:hypothetical protein n=1 Tax=Kitasatospora sp. NBC_01287 TaxID=2903573 RepID=UPI00224F1597|nr:hypothetical protein [Kitasatospora sp. NBC_01287]MCX4751424.1 hypothetical protein [Kitasatospora sp. NBC_01287]
MLNHTTPLWKIPAEHRRAFLHARARALSAEGASPKRLLRASDAAHTIDFREPREGEEE